MIHFSCELVIMNIIFEQYPWYDQYYLSSLNDSFLLWTCNNEYIWAISVIILAYPNIIVKCDVIIFYLFNRCILLSMCLMPIMVQFRKYIFKTESDRQKMVPCDRYGQSYYHFSSFSKATALATDLKLIPIHSLPMCAITFEMKEKSIFTQLLNDESMKCALLPSINCKNASWILLCTKIFFTFLKKKFHETICLSST